MRVLLNFAISADGKIGTHAGGASKFTSRQDLERLWQIRKRADALMVGRGTLEADNMSMTIAPEAQPTRQPLRIIVSRKGQFNYEHPVFHNPGGQIHLLSTDRPLPTPATDLISHHMSLESFLLHCEHELGVETLLCEGGGELVQALARLSRIDEINLTLAGHTLIGGQQAPGVLGQLKEHLPSSLSYRMTHFEPLECGECFLTYERQSP